MNAIARLSGALMLAAGLMFAAAFVAAIDAPAPMPANPHFLARNPSHAH